MKSFLGNFYRHWANCKWNSLDKCLIGLPYHWKYLILWQQKLLSDEASLVCFCQKMQSLGYEMLLRNRDWAKFWKLLHSQDSRYETETKSKVFFVKKLSIFFVKWAIPGLFFVYFRSFSNKQNNFYNKSMWKNVKSIQYLAPGFEPTTFGSWVSSHTH